ncbi:MAG: hypothetical protein CML13_08525 [Puniceicoccaceae bacterium]|nr:hypothetical protein [Puniceicoccaceae bacterium]
MSASLLAHAETEVFRVNQKGQVNVAGVQVELIHFGPGWSCTNYGTKMESLSDSMQNGARHIEALWHTSGGDYQVKEVIKEEAGGEALSISYDLSSESGVATKQIALSVSLPVHMFAGKTLRVDEREVPLPRVFDKLNVKAPWKGTQVSLPIGDSWLHLSFGKAARLLIQDGREFGHKNLELRVMLSGEDTSRQAGLDLRMRYTASPSTTVVMEANDQWRPFTHSVDVVPGSILDLSAGLEAPAGKYGPIIVNENGHFGFSENPAKRIRLLGANLCFSANFLTKEEADRMAERFRRMGYNSVRFHHYDGMLTEGNGDTTGIELNAEKLDRLDYMFAAMKKAGMYVTIDLYTFRDFSPGMIPEMDGKVKTEIKALVPILPSAFDAWSGMVERLLYHVNPYTGIAWKDDPAFFSVCPLNEDTINFVSHASGQQVKDLYKQAFKDYLEERGEVELEGKARTSQYYAFLQDIKAKSNRQLESFIKGISPHLLVTGSNFIADRHQVFFRSQFDFVDNHQYGDHPSFPVNSWRLPHAYKQQSVTQDFAEVPRKIMPSRIFGRPFTVTEYHYCPPNIYRAEGGTLMGAYSALQDWDGLYRFAWAQGVEKGTTAHAIRGFDMATDPISMMGERQVALLYARGDVAPATSRVVYPVDMDEVLTNWWSFSEKFSRLGLAVQIGTWAFDKEEGLPGTFEAASGIRQPEGYDEPTTPWISFEDAAEKFGTADNVVTSETSEIQLNVLKGEVKVVTERSESLVLHEGNEASGEALSANAPSVFCNVSASSMDDLALSESQRVLLMHLTDVRNTKMHFQNDQLQLMEGWGELPHLIRRGSVEVSLENTNEGMALYAVDMSGNRLGLVPTTYSDGSYHFTLNTAPDGSEPRMVYELVKE